MTSEIALREEQNGTAGALVAYGDAAIARLEKWAHAAVAAHQFAEGICGTSMVPQAYRNKPDEAAAAILAGAELNLDPMASLRAFDNIQGQPAPKALTLRAVTLAAGHDVRVVESTDTRAIVEGRRKGDTEWQRSTWSLDRAGKLGLLSKDQWKKQPAAMLVARATAEVCRWVGGDAVMGMPYASEEIADHTGARPEPVTRHVSAADIVGAAVAHVADQVEGDQGDQLTVDQVLSMIQNAVTAAELDDIRALCQSAGLRDRAILAAWKTRYDQLTEPVPDAA